MHGARLHLCRQLDRFQRLCRLIRRTYYTLLLGCHTSTSFEQEGKRNTGLVLDERSHWFYRQRHFVSIYPCFQHHFLFPIRNASGCADYELYGLDDGWVDVDCCRILVLAEEGVCRPSLCAVGKCYSGKGCHLRLCIQGNQVAPM